MNGLDDSFSSESSSEGVGLAQRLREVAKAYNGYQFVQQNGQRIFSPSPCMDMHPPLKGSEIFIGNIPKNMYEDELIPLFQTAGKLLQFRLMLNFQDRARGYGFATYLNPNHVPRAIEKFDGYETRFGKKLTVRKSEDNRRLFFGNIPNDKTRDEFFAMCTLKFSGVTDVIMHPNWEDNTKNRGFAFVEFESHNHASVARRMLHPRNLLVWDCVIYVDWAEPIPEVDRNVMAQVTVLYVKNLPYGWDQLQTRDFLSSYVGTEMIVRAHKINTFAFVHCKNRRDAETVKRALTGLKFGNPPIEVEWARPREYSANFQALKNPNSVSRRRRGIASKKFENTQHAFRPLTWNPKHF